MNKSSMSTPSNTDGGKIVEQAKQAATHVAEQAKEKVSSQLNTQFDTRKDKAVETMGNVADAIRGTSEQLKGIGPLGDVAERAATGIESVAEFFEGKHVGDIVRDVERFARREPALFLGATFALGLIGGRFLKSSTHRGSGRGGPDAARAGGYGYDRGGLYESSYAGADDGDDDFLSGSDLEESVDTMRFGASGATTRERSNTLPMGSRTAPTPLTSAASVTNGSSQDDAKGTPGSL